MSNHHLQIKDLTVSYHRVPAIHHVNFEAACGNCVALLGPNGAGKTTLLKAIVGLIPPETGSVTFHSSAMRASAADIAYLPQRSTIDWDFPITVRGMVETGCYLRLGLWRFFRKEDQERVDSALETMHLRDLADRQISALSGGQQQRAFLARALAQDAHVFLLDEPFAGLDKSSQESLGQTMRQLAGKENLVIASHHDLKTVPELFDHVLFLNGELIAFGKTEEVFTNANIAGTFNTEVFSGSAHDLAH